MNGIYVVGAILIAVGIGILSQTGLLTSSQIVYYPAIGTILVSVGAVVCYEEYASGKLSVDKLQSL